MRRRIRSGIYEFLYRHRLTPWAQRAFRLFGQWRPLNEPIFIVGIQRSGTSFLRDCLANSREIVSYNEMNDMWDPLGYPWESAQRPRPYWFLDPQGYINTAYEEVGHAYYQAVPGMCSMRATADRGLFNRFRFLNKCPMHTLRIPLLRELFPDACFVSIVRNPLAVIRSAAEKIAVKLEKHPRSGVKRRADGKIDYSFDGRTLRWDRAIDSFAQSYAHVVERQLSDLSAIDDSRTFCISYEEFVGNIHGTLRTIDDKFRLDSTRRPWEAIPETQISRNSKYQQQFDPETVDIVLGRCRSLMQQLGYQAERQAA